MFLAGLILGLIAGGCLMALCFAYAETNPHPPYGSPVIEVDGYDALEQMLTENGITFIKRTPEDNDC